MRHLGKRIAGVLLALVLMLGMLPGTVRTAAAETVDSGTCGDNLTWMLDDGGTLSISGTGKMTNWWPSSDVPWYDFRDTITRVVIEPGVTSIGNDAFYGCTSLTSITIPDSVTSIGASAFTCCTNLTSITIPDSVTYIAYSAFGGCTGLASINVTAENPAYASEDGVLFNKGKTELIRCPLGKSGTYTIPERVISIEGDAFFDCTNLVSIMIPNSVTSIAWSAFYNCVSLTNIDVSETNPVYASENGVLFNKGKTELIECPKGKAGAYTIPDSVTSIGDDAFYNCTSLTSVTIPESVTSIGIAAFQGCTSLASVFFKGNAPDVPDDGIINDPFFWVSTTIYYPANDDTWTEEVRQSYHGDITWVAYEPTPVYTLGDVDGSGVVNAKDVSILRRYLAGGYDVTIQESAADVDRNGTVNAKDVTMLRRYLAGGYDVTLGGGVQVVHPQTG